MLKTNPIRKTKKLETLFRRYEVDLRETDSTVVHAVTGSKTELDPMAFAVFETAIKAIYLADALHQRSESSDRWYGRIAYYNDFLLPDPDSVPWTKSALRCKQATKDYYYCVSVLSKAGLYYALLD